MCFIITIIIIYIIGSVLDGDTDLAVRKSDVTTFRCLYSKGGEGPITLITMMIRKHCQTTACRGAFESVIRQVDT